MVTDGIVDGTDDGASGFTAQPTVVRLAPPFTGTLNLATPISIELTARWLLKLPGGLHFRRLLLSQVREGEVESANALVVGCLGLLGHA